MNIQTGRGIAEASDLLRWDGPDGVEIGQKGASKFKQVPLCMRLGVVRFSLDAMVGRKSLDRGPVLSGKEKKTTGWSEPPFQFVFVAQNSEKN